MKMTPNGPMIQSLTLKNPLRPLCLCSESPMNALTILRSLGPIDSRVIRRDSMLRWMLFMPLLTGLYLPLRNTPG